MGFSLVGFGAGLAESAIERIEEERKFSNLALQGRIERASVLKMQREKEAEALRKELLEQKASLQQYGIDDPEVQKAYLTTPTLAEALKKSLGSGEVKVENANQYARQFANINKDKLPSGTVDEFIAAAHQAARGGGTVEPARVTPTEGGSIFAPSVSGQQKRLEQFASARGMTLEEVARAESPAALSRPEPAASINFDALRKPEKITADEKLKRLEASAIDAATTFGAEDPRTIKAKTQYNAYRSGLEEMRKDRIPKHEALLSQYRAILYDPDSKATPEEKERARKYIESYRQETRKDTEDGGPGKRTEATALTGFRERGANAVLLKYGGKKGFTQREIDLGEGRGKLFDLEYTDNNPELRKEVMAYRQLAMLTHPSAVREMQANNGKIVNEKLRNALGSFGIDFNNNSEPILVSGKTLKQALEDERSGAGSAASTGTSSVQSTPNRAPAMVSPKPASVTDAGRAGQGRAPTPVAPTGIAQPTTEEEVRALKPGALYINPADGRVYTKN